jgi:hypothetical protein
MGVTLAAFLLVAIFCLVGSALQLLWPVVAIALFVCVISFSIGISSRGRRARLPSRSSTNRLFSDLTALDRD